MTFENCRKAYRSLGFYGTGNPKVSQRYRSTPVTEPCPERRDGFGSETNVNMAPLR
jgi:hypothetical protein